MKKKFWMEEGKFYFGNKLLDLLFVYVYDTLKSRRRAGIEKFICGLAFVSI